MRIPKDRVAATRMAVALVAAALAAALLLPCGVAAAASPPDGQIAFVREAGSGGNDGVWIVNTDGTGERLLTDEVGKVYDLAWSKDGSKLAIISVGGVGSNTGSNLWIMEADGSGLRGVEVLTPAEQRGLTDAGGDMLACTWSPDGNKLAVWCDWEDEEADWGTYNVLVVVDLKTGQSRELNEPTSLTLGSPSWHPGGETILVSEGGDDAAWLVNIDARSGGESAELPIDALVGSPGEGLFLWNYGCTYSPDGKRIAAIQEGWSYDYSSAAGSALFVCSADGTRAREVLQTSEGLKSVSWSPDGGWLAFTHYVQESSGNRGPDQIALIPADAEGAQPVELMAGSLPMWRPSGSGAALGWQAGVGIGVGGLVAVGGAVAAVLLTRAGRRPRLFSRASRAQAQPPARPAGGFCMWCGASLEGASRAFCIRCGKPLSGGRP